MVSLSLFFLVQSKWSLLYVENMKYKLYEKFVPNVLYKNKKESEFQISIE